MKQGELITVNDLSIAFRTADGLRQATQHITFTITAGKTVALVGESGSGKSISTLSLMQLLAKGKAVFTSGHLVLHEAFLNGAPARQLLPTDNVLSQLRGKDIAMIFQEPMTALNPVMRCGDQLVEMICLHQKVNKKNARSKALELFKEVQLPRPEEMLDNYPHQLSGGQRQRVMIAMAISCSPKVLIADEPTTALDVTVQKGILDLLKILQQKHGMGIVFITHDLGVVKDIADEIVVMRRGEMMEKGEAKSVLDTPQNDYTRGLLACRPSPDRKGRPLLTVEDVLSARTITDTPYTKHNGEVMLSVRDLTKVYVRASGFLGKDRTEVRAVNNVSFDVRKGETLGLVGESGCGKTTLSRMLLGLIQSTSGSIAFNGEEVSRASEAQWKRIRKRIQIIFQDPYSSLNPKLTIGHAIMEPMKVYGLHGNEAGRRARCAALLERVGLPAEAMERYPHEFSGGQRQRVVIARALAVEPELIICDESVSALDVSVQAQVLNLLNELKEHFQLTYIFISHDLNVVYHMSDRIMVMQRGSIEELGEADQVFLRPQSEYTRKLVASIPGGAH